VRLPTISLMVVVLLCGSFAAAQEPTKSEPKEKTGAKATALEAALAKALKHNPDIHVAESKVREAEAELNRVRLSVMQKVVKLHHEIAAYKLLVAPADMNLERAVRLHMNRAISQEEFNAIQQAAQQAKANLAKAEAEWPFLLGNAPATAPDGDGWGSRIINRYERDYVNQLWQAQFGKIMNAPVAGTMADKIREVLDMPIKLDFKDVRMSDVLEHLRSHAKGMVNIHNATLKADEGPISVRFSEPVPFGAAAQWLEDTLNVRFVIRDYGIVITEPKNLPPGAMLLHDFWKANASKKKVERKN